MLPKLITIQCPHLKQNEALLLMMAGAVLNMMLSRGLPSMRVPPAPKK
jgi:hypothetical protein